MILFIPVTIIFIFASVIAILGRSRLNIVQAWILNIVTIIITLLSFIIVRLLGNASWSTSYLVMPGFQDALFKFQLDEKNWIFGVLVIGVLFASLLYESNHLFTTKNNNIWFTELFITGMGLLTIYSRSLVSFIFFSTLMDFGLMLFHANSVDKVDQKNEPIRQFIYHCMGSLLILFGLLIQTNLGFLLVSLGVMIRFGFLSLILQKAGISEKSNIFPFFKNSLIAITLFAYFYGNGMQIGDFAGKYLVLFFWMILSIGILLRIWTAKKPFVKNNLLISLYLWFGGFLVIAGKLTAFIPFLIVIISMSATLILYEDNSRLYKTLFLILLLGIIGLPYSPSYGIWLLQGNEKSTFLLIVFTLLLFVLLVSTIVYVYRKSRKKNQKQEWTVAISAISPFVILLIPWLLEFWLLPGVVNINYFLLPGLLTLVLFLPFVGLRIPFISQWFSRLRFNFDDMFTRILNGLSTLLSLKWLVKFFSKLFALISELITLITRILDGDGGLLWSFVFLILMATVFITTGNP